MRFGFIGDIVGKSGISCVVAQVPAWRQQAQLDVVIANGENAYNGSGLSPGQYHNLCGAGIDLITLGDHAYKKREIYSILGSMGNIARPANFPSKAPGRGWASFQMPDGRSFSVIVLLGRVFMRPVDCPFQCVDEILTSGQLPSGPVLVEFHAEATSDKQLMGHYLDGRVAAVLGTHTHVTTADERILPKGTAFQCDVGMSGPHSGVIGRETKHVLKTVLTFEPTSFLVAEGEVEVHATVVEIDDETGLAKSIERVVLKNEP